VFCDHPVCHWKSISNVRIKKKKKEEICREKYKVRDDVHLLLHQKQGNFSLVLVALMEFMQYLTYKLLPLGPSIICPRQLSQPNVAKFASHVFGHLASLT
jgi:hypothetical protein